MIAFGIGASALTSRPRGAVFLFLGVVLISFGVPLADLLIAGMPAERFSPLAQLKNLLSASSTLVGWISPFAYLVRGLDAARAGIHELYLRNVCFSSLYSLILLTLAMLAFRWKGVRG